MKSILELELELANAKLAKMTSTVKQLGTKLSSVNEDNNDLQMELCHLRSELCRLRTIENSVRKAVLTKNESHSWSIDSFEFNVTHKEGW